MSFLKSTSFLKISYRNVRDISKRLKLQELYYRRMEVGPEKPRHRSEFLEWNYDSEIFAFGKRLKEEFSEQFLRQAFIDKSYLSSVPSSNISDNSELKKYGFELTSGYVRTFLNCAYPHVPLEWIDQIYNHLLSTHTIATVSGHLGTKDLILCDSVEIDLKVESDVLFAIIGALAKSQTEEIAQTFVKDFILTQLTLIHLTDLIIIDKPYLLLTGVLRYHRKGDPKPRILRQSAVNSVYACYHVGIYSNEILIGQAPGDSIKSAEIWAIKHSLFYLFGIPENRVPIDFKSKIELDINKTPISISEYMKFL